MSTGTHLDPFPGYKASDMTLLLVFLCFRHYNLSDMHTVPVVQACALSGMALTVAFDPAKLTRGGDSLGVQPFDRSRPGEKHKHHPPQLHSWEHL